MDQKKPTIFYGWWVVAACFLILVYTSGIVLFGFTALFQPIANEFGWSYTQISLATSIRGMEVGLVSPVAGLLCDRWGPRRVVFIGVAAIGLGLIFLSRINSLGMFYTAFILMATGTSTCGGTVPMAAVGNWFRRNVATATGIMVSGTALSGLLIPVITTVIDNFGWRTAMVIMGIGTFAIPLPLSLMLRHKPEQYGYLPDGDTASAVAGSKAAGITAGNEMTTGQALKSRVFWFVAIAFMLGFMVINAVTTHVMPYLGSVGISRATASLVASGAPVVSMLGRLSFGWLGDRYDKRKVTAAGFGLIALGMFFFEFVSAGGMWLIVPFVILFGIGWGGNVPMTAAMVREYFGRSRLGTILGLVMGVMMIGTVIGPPAAGWVFDTYASYHGVWLGFAGLVIAGAIIMLAVPRRTERPLTG